MEPHVFARFKRIELRLDFDFENDEVPPAPQLGIGSQHNIDVDDCLQFSLFIRRTKVFRDFATVISNSSGLSVLRIALKINGSPNFDMDFDDDSNDALESEAVYFEFADKRAKELFLQSGVMDPLRCLCNVQTAIIEFDRYDGMSKEYEDIMRNLAVDIETPYCPPECICSLIPERSSSAAVE